MEETQGIVPKTPKQMLYEFYSLNPTAQKPTFQVVEVPGTSAANPVMFKATVVCPAVHHGPDNLAFEDLIFEGVGKSKRAAEHDCAEKAFAYIRNVPGLKLPSANLTAIAAAATMATAQAAGLAVPQQAAAVQPNYIAAAGATMFGASAAAPPALGGFPLGLTINEAMIESMTAEQLKMALREVLGLYKALVQGVHAESQRHAAELNAIIMRQL